MRRYPDELRVEVRDNGVVVATLNRPEVLNALNGALREGIYELIGEVANDASLRALVITGAGRGFCSGADLRAKDQRSWPRGSADPEFAWCVDLLQMPKPTSAAINGVAAGGGLGIALLCDFRICSAASRLIPALIHRSRFSNWEMR